MMDDETRWQDATLPADGRLVGPPSPDGARHEDGDYDEIESGIASIFAAMQAAGDDDESAGGDGHEDGDASYVDAHTFQLLSELDRLWQRPAP